MWICGFGVTTLTITEFPNSVKNLCKLLFLTCQNDKIIKITLGISVMKCLLIYQYNDRIINKNQTVKNNI